MAEYVIKQEVKGNRTVKVVYDTCASNPRKDDNLGTIVSKKGYGDEHEFNWDDYNSYEEYQKDIERKKNVGVILPVYKYEHSGIALNTKGFNCRWDSCQIGFIYITKEKIREEYGVKRITQEIRDKVIKVLEAEIGLYSSYLNGDVYGYQVIDNETDEEVASCYGFDDMDECLEEGLNCVEDDEVIKL